METCMLRKNVCLSLIFYIGGILFPVYSIEPLSNDSVSVELTDSIAKEINLEEVSVTGQMPLIENKADRKIIRISGSYLENTTDGDEMLRLTPGLIRVNGGITVPGSKKTTYYLNGKKVISFDEIVSLDPKNVKKIEIIHNPPAMYEADGDAVVLIVTKRANESALRVGVTYKQSKYAGVNAYADGTFRRGIFTMNGRYSYGYNQDWTEESNLSALSSTDSLHTVDYYKGRVHHHNARLVFDWVIGENHNLNVDFNGYYQNGGGESTRYVSFTSEKYDDYMTYFKKPRRNYEINAILNYKYKIDSLGQSLNVLAEASFQNRDGYRNYYNAPINKVPENPIWTYNHNISSPLYFSGQIDYVKPIREIWRIETGVKCYSLGTDTKTDVSGGVIYNQIYSTQEHNLAEYVMLSVEPTKNLSLSAGLRCETMWRKSMRDGICIIDTVNVDFFPSFSILYTFSDKYNLGLSYSSRIERPLFYMLDPSLSIDPLLNKHGNPNLINTKNHKISLSTTLVRDLYISAFATYIKYPIAYYIYKDGENPMVTDIRYLNTRDYWRFGGDISYNKTFFKIWDFSVYAGVYSNNFEYEEDGVKKNNNIPGAYAGCNNQIALPWDLKLAVNFNIQYNGSEDSTIDSPFCYSYISLKRSFLNDSLNVSISLNNIFGNTIYVQESVLDGHNICKLKDDDRYGKISLTYNIGKSYNYRSKSESQEEKNRM